jgi:hypothetical protein
MHVSMHAGKGSTGMGHDIGGSGDNVLNSGLIRLIMLIMSLVL